MICMWAYLSNNNCSHYRPTDIISDNSLFNQGFIIIVDDASGTCSQRILNCFVTIFVYSVTRFMQWLIFSTAGSRI